VRGETQRSGLPGETLYLEYEAYEEMAVAKMGQIAREIWERWPRCAASPSSSGSAGWG
jgi:molybdopterin synthase catalytic subunit